jgi:AraC-like DNA-binding protein
LNKSDKPMRYRPIRNSAQLSPSAVRFQTRAPDADLAPYVSDFWQYDVLPPHQLVPIQVFPSGCVVLRFNLYAAAVESVIYGPSLRPDMKSVFVSGVPAFGAALRLEGARALIHCDIAELCDLRLDLRLFWRHELSALCEQLALASSFEARSELLARYMRRELSQRYAPHGDLQHAIARLVAHGESSALPRELNVSERTLRRYFTSHVGLAPKALQRVVRVQATMRALVERPLLPRSRLALALGFSDQPHWNREFKRLLDMSPGHFGRYIGRFHEQELPIWTELNRRMLHEPWFERMRAVSR